MIVFIFETDFMISIQNQNNAIWCVLHQLDLFVVLSKLHPFIRSGCDISYCDVNVLSWVISINGFRCVDGCIGHATGCRSKIKCFIIEQMVFLEHQSRIDKNGMRWHREFLLKYFNSRHNRNLCYLKNVQYYVINYLKILASTSTLYVISFPRQIAISTISLFKRSMVVDIWIYVRTKKFVWNASD